MSLITELFAPSIALPLYSITELALTFDIANNADVRNYKKVDKMTNSYKEDGYEVIETHYFPVYLNIVKKYSTYILITYAYDQTWDVIIKEKDLSSIRDSLNIILLEKQLIYTLQQFLDKGYIIKQSSTIFARSFVFDLIHPTQQSYSLSLISVTKRKANLLITRK